jgi:hypothetical protein
MQKTLLLLICCIACSMNLFAQLEKNQLYPGLSFTSGFKSTGYELQPSASFALGKHSMLSVFGRVQQSKESFNPYLFGHSSTMSSYGFGVSYTYYHYFGKSTKLGWYIDASLSRNNVTLTDKQLGSVFMETSHRELQFIITPGLFYKPSNRVMLFLNAGGINAIGSYGTSRFGNVINVGVKVRLGK